MKEALVQFCGRWRIVMASTFGPRRPTWIPSGLGAPSVLDYIVLPGTQSDVGVKFIQPLGATALTAVSDHALLHATLQCAPTGVRRQKPKVTRASSLVHWAPQDPQAYAREVEIAFTTNVSAPVGSPATTLEEGWELVSRSHPRVARHLRTVVEEEGNSTDSTETMMEDTEPQLATFCLTAD
eukprot:9474680-Pyramimonas_sp.AAC.1